MDDRVFAEEGEGVIEEEGDCVAAEVDESVLAEESNCEEAGVEESVLIAEGVGVLSAERESVPEGVERGVGEFVAVADGVKVRETLPDDDLDGVADGDSRCSESFGSTASKMLAVIVPIEYIAIESLGMPERTDSICRPHAPPAETQFPPALPETLLPRIAQSTTWEKPVTMLAPPSEMPAPRLSRMAFPSTVW